MYFHHIFSSRWIQEVRVMKLGWVREIIHFRWFICAKFTNMTRQLVANNLAVLICSPLPLLISNSLFLFSFFLSFYIMKFYWQKINTITIITYNCQCKSVTVTMIFLIITAKTPNFVLKLMVWTFNKIFSLIIWSGDFSNTQLGFKFNKWSFH